MNCDYCKKLKRSEWLGRLAAEAFQADFVRFVTLTYDDDHVDNATQLPATHIKKYMERRRTKYALRHFTVGEFGDKTHRPHWHSLQFYYGKQPDDQLDYSERHFGWGRGNSQYEKPRSIAGCCAYIYDYLDKGGKALRPSNGIGKDYLLKFARLQARNRKPLTRDDRGVINFYVPGVRTPQGSLWQYGFPKHHPWALDMAHAYLAEWQALWTDPSPDKLMGINWDWCSVEDALACPSDQTQTQATPHNKHQLPSTPGAGGVPR